jgi:hypothetical protein
MDVTLDSLSLNQEHLQAAREEIRRNAYFKWQKAGCPEGDPLRFWCEAEYEWIEFQYVPDRPWEESEGLPHSQALQKASSRELAVC